MVTPETAITFPSMVSAGFPPSGMALFMTVEKINSSPLISTRPNPEDVPKYNWLFEIASISMMPLSGKPSFTISAFLSKLKDGGNENPIEIMIKNINFIHNPQHKKYYSRKHQYSNYHRNQK